MSDDFFGDLGKSISRTTQNAVGRATSLIASARLNAEISVREKEIERLYARLGRLVFQRAEAGKAGLEHEELLIVDEVKERRSAIGELREDLASARGMKVCPSCGEIIDADVAFCPKCGAPTPMRESGDPDGKIVNIPVMPAMNRINMPETGTDGESPSPEPGEETGAEQEGSVPEKMTDASAEDFSPEAEAKDPGAGDAERAGQTDESSPDAKRNGDGGDEALDAEFVTVEDNGK